MAGGLFPPPQIIRSWPAPNHTNPETHSPAILILCCILGPLTFLVVGARLWARFRIQRNAGLDDWLMLAALVPTAGMIFCIAYEVEDYGFKRHIYDNPIAWLIPQRKLVLASEMFYVYAASLIKCSILLFYRRMGIRSLSRTFVLATKLCLATVILACIAYTLVIVLSCIPLSGFWNRVDPTRTDFSSYICADEFASLLSAFVVFAVQDIITATLPVLLLRKLDIPFRQKVALAGVFAIGYIACAFAIVRIYYVYRLFMTSYDASWFAWYIFIFMLLEVLVAAMCACAPALSVYFYGSVDLPSVNSVSRPVRNSWQSARTWFTQTQTPKPPAMTQQSVARVAPMPIRSQTTLSTRNNDTSRQSERFASPLPLPEPAYAYHRVSESSESSSYFILD